MLSRVDDGVFDDRVARGNIGDLETDQDRHARQPTPSDAASATAIFFSTLPLHRRQAAGGRELA
jgi:hypothetical protein